MLKILIVEDQVLIANHIKDILNESGYLTNELAFKFDEATYKLKSFNPDIILLDINVEGRDSGIFWAKENFLEKKVIFITGQTEIETLKKALTIKPIAYLTKPVKKIDLIASIELGIETTKEKTIKIKDGYNEVKINFEDILYIKSDKNYIDIQTTEKKYSVRITLDNFQKDLNPSIFHRVHRSYIINKEKISKKTTTSVHINEYEIPISRGLEIKL